MKSNYVTPQVNVFVIDEDVITTSNLETTEGFDKDWLKSTNIEQ